MKKKTADPKEYTQQETQLIEQLREHPEMMERVQCIMEITRNAAGPLKTADEVEGLLIEEMRRYIVEPSCFTTLKRGGPQHGFCVEVIVYNGGHLFTDGSDELLPYRLLTFNQK